MKKVKEKKEEVTEAKDSIENNPDRPEEENKETANPEDTNSVNEEKASESVNLSKRQNKQVIYAIILMILLVMIIFMVPLFIKNFMNKFDYKGLEFQKTKTGDLFLYSMKVPLFNQNQQVTDYYKINLREDPRTLSSINVQIPENEVIFMRNNATFISVDSDAPICEDNVFSVLTLSYFLKDFGGLEIKGATDDPDVAKEKRLAYATCENSPNNTVISVRYSNETAIIKKSENCYEITYKDCEINSAVERFILIILEKYMGYIKT